MHTIPYCEGTCIHSRVICIFHFFHTKGWFPAFPTSGAKAEDKHSWEPLAGGELTSLKGEMYIGKDLDFFFPSGVLFGIFVFPKGSGSSAANSGYIHLRICETRVACFFSKKAREEE